MVGALRLQILRALPRDPHQRHGLAFPSRLSGRASSMFVASLRITQTSLELTLGLSAFPEPPQF